MDLRLNSGLREVACIVPRRSIAVQEEVNAVRQRGPPLRGVLIRVISSLAIVFIIALMSRVTGRSVVELIIGFIIVLFSHESIVKPVKLKLKKVLQEAIKSIVNKEVKTIYKEESDDITNND